MQHDEPWFIDEFLYNIPTYFSTSSLQETVTVTEHPASTNSESISKKARRLSSRDLPEWPEKFQELGRWKFSRTWKRFFQSFLWTTFWSGRGNQMSVTLTILPRIGQNLWKFSWNQCMLSRHRSDTNGNCWEQVRRTKKKQCCCNQVWTKNGGLILRSVIAICETFKISWLMGIHHVIGGVPLNGPVISFGAMVE